MTKIVAHRGFSKRYPENTMLAFHKAVETGCDGIELDVQFTRDGELVIIHDETIDRTTDGVGQVRDYTLAELRRFNAYGAFEGQYEFQPIPTLREYFEWMQDKPQFTNIELKNGIYLYPELEEKVIALVREFHLEGRIEFSSFNHQSMLHCKALAPELPTGLLVSCWLVDGGAYGRAAKANDINARYVYFTPENVAEIHANGLACNAWTVDRPEEIRRLGLLKIKSIITNCPDLAKEILATL